MKPEQPITLPKRDRRRIRAVRRSVVQFRVTPAARAKADSLLARLQGIAPDAKLTLTDLMTAAMTQYITAVEDKIAGQTESAIREELMAAFKAIEAERLQTRKSVERLAKNI